MEDLGEPDTAKELQNKKERFDKDVAKHSLVDAALWVIFVAMVLWVVFSDPTVCPFYLLVAFIPFAGIVFHYSYMSGVHRDIREGLAFCNEHDLRGNWENYDEPRAFMKKIHNQNRLPTRAEMRKVNSWACAKDTLEAWDTAVFKTP